MSIMEYVVCVRNGICALCIVFGCILFHFLIDMAFLCIASLINVLRESCVSELL